MTSLRHLPAAGSQFQHGATTYTCVGRFLTRHGIVRAKNGDGEVRDLMLNATDWRLIRAAE